jgi:glucose/arabinose dehydrogenase
MTKAIPVAAAAGVLVSAAVLLPQPSESKPEQTKRVSVTQMFNDNCNACHGEDGAGGGAGANTFISEARFSQDYDRRFFDSIKEGLPQVGMAAFGETMTDKQIWGMVVHIRELQKKGLRAKFGSPTPVDGVYKSEKHDFKVEDVVTEGLSTPWSLDWLADGRMLVTNRPGGIMLFDGGSLVGELEGLPPVVQQGQGGQMEVAVHESGWIYISVADPAGEGAKGAMTKLYRGKLDGLKWTSQETIYEADQEYYSGAGVHFGCKIIFDDEGHVFFGVGERGTNARVQDTSTPYGKTMRLNLDGSIPDDNPIPGNPMWAYGHRNPQGMTVDLDGNIWNTEHGPRGGDEVNLITKGANYGWPIYSLSINYNDSPDYLPWPEDEDSIAQPAFRWLPSVGSSGMDTITGSAFPEWNGDLIAGGLSGKNVDRFTMEDGEMVEHEELLHGLGRVRAIETHKDGTIYVALNGPDKIIRLVPAD